MGVINRNGSNHAFITNKECFFRTLDPQNPLKAIPGLQGAVLSNPVFGFHKIKKFGYWEENRFVYKDVSDIDDDILNYNVTPIFCLITSVEEIKDTEDVEVKYYNFIEGYPPFAYQVPTYYSLRYDSDYLYVNGYTSLDFMRNSDYAMQEEEFVESMKENAVLKPFYEEGLENIECSMIMPKEEAENLGITKDVLDDEFAINPSADIWNSDGSFKYPIKLKLGAFLNHNTDPTQRIVFPSITSSDDPINYYIYSYEDLNYIITPDELNSLQNTDPESSECCDDILSKIDELKESINNNTEDIKNTIKEGGQGGGLDDETKCKINRIDASIISLRNMLR